MIHDENGWGLSDFDVNKKRHQSVTSQWHVKHAYCKTIDLYIFHDSENDCDAITSICFEQKIYCVTIETHHKIDTISETF